MKRRGFLGLLASLFLPHTYFLRPSAKPKDADVIWRINHVVDKPMRFYVVKHRATQLRQYAMKHNVCIVTAVQRKRKVKNIDEEELSRAFQEQSKGI